MKNYLISVILPVYNDEKFIKEAIDSILQQTYENYELIIINDGSTDSTSGIIDSYDVPRIKVLSNNKNRGITFSLNKGIELSTGQYIARMDSNDIAHPQRLEKQVSVIQNNDNIGLVSSFLNIIDEKGNLLRQYQKDISPLNSQVYTFFRPYTAHSSVMYKKNLLSKKAYNADYDAEDIKLLFELSMKTDFYIIPEFLMDIRHKVNGGLNQYNSYNIIKSHKNIIKEKLNELEIIATDWEIDYHFHYGRKTQYTDNEARLILEYFNKLYVANKKINIFNEPYFSNFLLSNYLHVIKKVEKFNINLSSIILSSSINKKVTFNSLLKIIIKGFINTLGYYKKIRSGNYTINMDKEVWNQLIKKYGHINRTTKNYLNDYEMNNFSQNGEDGVLSYILNHIGPPIKYFVEFGAWDGKRYSNSFNLKKYYNWEGILFEKDYNKVQEGKKNKIDNLFQENIKPDNIDKIFKKYKIPYNFALLSIDIDSDDYWVWKGLTEFHPILIIIETHPAIPNEYPLTTPYGKSDMINGYYGANLLAMCQLAKKKGYVFVTTVFFNAIFIRKDYYQKLRLPKLTNKQIISKYFELNEYWYKNKDRKNRKWVNLDFIN